MCVCVCGVVKVDEKKTVLNKPSSVQEGGMVGSIATSLWLQNKKKNKKEGGQEEYKRSNKRMKD